MNILEELWYGNIHPCDLPVERNSDYAKARNKVAKGYEALLPKLSTECKEALDQLMDTQMNEEAIATRDAFLTGFRLGARMILEISFENSCR